MITFTNRWTHHPLFQRWLSRRLPASTNQTLSHKSIFILPSGFGMVWLLMALVLFLFGTNYQNNLVIALSLLMVSILITSLIFCYRNLAGLTIKAHWPSQVYAGETLAMPLSISSAHHAWQIRLHYLNNRPEMLTKANDLPSETLVPFVTCKRGRLSTGRVNIFTCYPTGLCRAWSYLDMDIKPLIFAKPHIPDNEKQYLSYATAEEISSHNSLNGVDEFIGLKHYIAGESLKHVAWKQMAQGRGMLTKQFSQPHHKGVWLSLPDNANNIEQQLSELSYLVDKFSHANTLFGLKLGQQLFSPATGESHRTACQRAIALYGYSD